MIIAAKEFWMNSPFSLARVYGAIKYDGHEFYVMQPKGDLVRDDWIPIYKVMGREWTIQLLKSDMDDKAKKRKGLEEMKKRIKENKEKKKGVDMKQKDFFE